MWWTNWASERPLTPEEIRDNSDVCKFALDMFEGRKLIYPARELIAATQIYIKASIFDIQTLPSWHTERVCLIGDAAHAVKPLLLPYLTLTRYLLIPVKERRWRSKIRLS